MAYSAEEKCRNSPEPADPIRDLLAGYLGVTGDVASVPAFSILGGFKLYLLALLWEICLVLLPFVLVINCMWRLVCSARRAPYSSIGSKLRSFVAAPFASLHEGEITALKMFVTRSVVRILVVTHIKHRIKRIRVAIAANVVAADLLNRENVPSNLNLGRNDRTARRLDRSLRSGTALATLALVPTVVSGLKATSDALDLHIFDKLLKAVESVLPPIKPITATINTVVDANSPPGEFNGEVIRWLVLSYPYLSYAAPVLTVVLILTWSCFIAKRQLFQSRAVYSLELKAFECLGESRAREIPIDLLATMVAIVLLGAYEGVLFTVQYGQRWVNGGGQVDTGELRANSALMGIDMIVGLLFYEAFILYALVRRYKLGRL